MCLDALLPACIWTVQDQGGRRQADESLTVIIEQDRLDGAETRMLLLCAEMVVWTGTHSAAVQRLHRLHYSQVPYKLHRDGRAPTLLEAV
jgi:hypothetical protein